MTPTPAAPTKVTPEQMLDAIEVAWTSAIGEPPKQATLALVLAHWALETGRGKSMKNFNVGNIKEPDVNKPHTYFQTWEQFPAVTADRYLKERPKTCKLLGVDATGKFKRLAFYPNDAMCRFRSYTTLEDGVADYLSLLQRRFTRAWPALVVGDPLKYVLALKAQGYMTADVSSYYRAINLLFSEYMALIKAGDMPETIEQIQAALTQLGFNPGPIDGEYGERTRDAIAQFQKAHNLLVDGVPGPKTKGTLQHELFRLKLAQRIDGNA